MKGYRLSTIHRLLTFLDQPSALIKSSQYGRI